jgi:hypothetical protein
MNLGPKKLFIAADEVPQGVVLLWHDIVPFSQLHGGAVITLPVTNVDEMLLLGSSSPPESFWLFYPAHGKQFFSFRCDIEDSYRLNCFQFFYEQCTHFVLKLLSLLTF